MIVEASPAFPYFTTGAVEMAFVSIGYLFCIPGD
jgi:hypothetical protein